jgi:ribonuclease P protein component
MPDQRFLSQYRIRRGADFRRAYQRRSSAADGQIVVFGCPNGLAYPRLGISASRRLGGAVVRNRWKRLLREAFRLARSELPAGIDLVVIPRPNVEPTLASLLDSLPRLAVRVAKKLGP